MLPSILAHELQEGTRRFLVTAFEPADRYFRGIVSRFVETPGTLTKGPYLQVGLPFRMGTAGRKFFSEFETKNEGFGHQEAAWRRLRSDGEPGNTLVVTGTGSGKTECFLYPVLQHCARIKASQTRGIKALVIYPMNALANDQARRFAETIAATPAFAGLRVGLYVGGRGDTSPVMTKASVITDRDAMRKTPPDVLLTNYKMLDYLLVRPRDRALWEHNAADTLRYVVVDELHTFDGAQGTDLALLLRRLRARLRTPAGYLVCTGTSATLGDGDAAALRAYAEQIFASPFEPASVVTEDRDTVVQFLGDAPINHLLQSRDDFAAVLDPGRYRLQADAIAAWSPVFFAGEPLPSDVTAPEWRVALGRALKQHLLVHNLLRVLKGGIGEWGTLQEQLSGPLPVSARPHAARVLDALVALLAWARDPKDPKLPLVTVRVQVWMRELRRLVANVVPRSDDDDDRDPARVPLLRAAADLKSTSEGLHLPLVQCIECHTTGWLARKSPSVQRVDPTLETIYNAWFRRSPELVRLYPDGSLNLPFSKYLCGVCGQLQDDAGPCAGCGAAGLTQVGIANETTTTQQARGPAFARHERTCPACGARDRFLLLGARAATLGAQLIEQGWATPFNDDKKLIAFSDSVQDAAHRAGFFGSRTYRNNVRMGIMRAVDALAAPTVPWPEFEAKLAAWLLDASRPDHFAPDAFVAEFIGPDMMGLRAWERLRETGGPVEAKLLARVKKRLAWEAFAEWTYISTRGRTLDRLGLATLLLPANALDAVIPVLHRRLVEEFGLRELMLEHVTHWLWGLIIRLKQRGAVTHEEMTTFAETGSLGQLTFGNRERKLWLPPLGPHSVRPQWLSIEGRHRDFESLLRKGRSWYELWLSAALGRNGVLLPPNGAADIYKAAFDALLGGGILRAVDGHKGRAVALEAARLVVDRDTVKLAGPRGGRELAVPRSLAQTLIGMPCLDALREAYGAVLERRDAEAWMARRYREGDIRRVIAAEHTGLLERDDREKLEERFKASGAEARPWYENLLSATPTLEMGVDIGSLSTLLLCSVPPSQASYLQRVGRAGRRDGNAVVVTLADGASPHDLYFYEDPLEMMAGQVTPPGTFLQAPEVLRRQLMAFCFDSWVAGGIPHTAFPDKTKPVLDTVERNDQRRFPYTFLEFVRKDELGLLGRFEELLDYRPVTDTDRRAVTRVLERLKAFMLGGEGVEGLRVSLLNALQQIRKEREVYLASAKDMKREIDRLEQLPQDEARDVQIREFKRERAKALEMATELGDRDLLNTLTDAGLLPNYAFPEAGVELRSLLWRHRRDDDDPGTKAYVTTTLRFERPAASALSEFAPENRFYANQRRVQIDQINMRLAETEEWRLCPSCHHVEKMLGQQLQQACPRCGTHSWSDVEQKRTLLRFRQAIANANDERTRIDDRSDDREPRFFVRQLLVDVDPTAVTVAWKLQDDRLAFGFEAIRRADFRDINFGEMGRAGVTFSVASRDLSRPGFKLCRHCGMVQGGGANAAQTHARDCRGYGQNDPNAIVHCLYLYREFSSEAVRILVPYTQAGMSETVLQSFMAALQLGLKRHFGGRVDHLRITTQEEPGDDDGPKRHYVLLYDSVPGGTGYLQQLLSEDAQTLTEVLKKAYDALRTCSCAASAEKDGCYRCLYQYRQARVLPSISRREAEALLADLLKSIDRLERVSSISAIRIDPQMDSVLEAQFIESLSRLSRQDGLPHVQVTQDVYKGRTAWLLEVGDNRYWVRPQVDLDQDCGVVAAVRPDFLIEPVRSSPARRPIALFTDGWLYHRDALRADARKRSALVASGRYWVWSVVWEDVQAALGGKAASVLDVVGDHARHAPNANIVANVRTRHGRGTGELTEHAVMRLLRWLAEPMADERASEKDDWVRGRRSDAAVLSSRFLLPPDSPDRAPATQVLSSVRLSLPDACTFAPPRSAPAWSAHGAGVVSVLLAWPEGYVKREYDAGHGAVILRPELADDSETLRRGWREWLDLFNELQVLPNTFLMTGDGMAHGDYVGLTQMRAPVAPDAVHDDQNWEHAMRQALGELGDGLRAMAASGVPPPDAVGVELERDGVVEGEAELQWEGLRLVVLAPHQVDAATAWSEAGWQVVRVDDGGWVAIVTKVFAEVTKA